MQLDKFLEYSLILPFDFMLSNCINLIVIKTLTGCFYCMYLLFILCKTMVLLIQKHFIFWSSCDLLESLFVYIHVSISWSLCASTNLPLIVCFHHVGLTSIRVILLYYFHLLGKVFLLLFNDNGADWIWISIRYQILNLICYQLRHFINLSFK